MKDTALLRTGLAGTAIAALCCFTPILVIVVAGVGASALIAWLDYALFPVLFASLGLVAYALILRSGRKGVWPGFVIAILAACLSAGLFWLEFRYALRISIAAVVAVAAAGWYLRRWPAGEDQNRTSAT